MICLRHLFTSRAQSNKKSVFFTRAQRILTSKHPPYRDTMPLARHLFRENVFIDQTLAKDKFMLIARGYISRNQEFEEFELIDHLQYFRIWNFIKEQKKILCLVHMARIEYYRKKSKVKVTKYHCPRCKHNQRTQHKYTNYVFHYTRIICRPAMYFTHDSHNVSL